MHGPTWGIWGGVGTISCKLSSPRNFFLQIEHPRYITKLRLTKLGPRNRPFFKRSETFHPPSHALQKQVNVAHDRAALGSSGPIQVSYPTEYSPSHALWHDTLNAVGVQTNSSHFGGSNVGVWTGLNAVNPFSGRRSFALDYCSSTPVRDNLFILTEATVSEIIIQQDDNGQCVATGARFTCQGRDFVVSASREVILSAVSVKSPQILELSGIGNPEVLARANVTVKVDSPRVGENLQDHLSKHSKSIKLTAIHYCGTDRPDSQCWHSSSRLILFLRIPMT